MKQKLVFRRTTILMWGFSAVLAGLAVGKNWGQVSLAWAIITLVIVGILFRKHHIYSILAVVICGFCFGLWRGNVYSQKLHTYNKLVHQNITILAVADNDGVYADKGQMSFDVSKINVISPYRQNLPGKMKVEGLGVTAVYRTDKLQISGRLYQTRGSRQGGISYAKIELKDRDLSWIEMLRLRFVAGMQSALPEPHASFGLGLLIGQRSTLPPELSSALAAVGLTHIIAVSGYNLTIIVRAVRRIGKKRSKYQKMIISLTLICLFVLVTGFSASIVRAALVSLFSLITWYYGRTFRPLLLLLMVASMTAFWYPIYLWSDIGWYLSFLAFFGVLVLVPVTVQKLFSGKRKPNAFLLLIFETIGAQIMTMPLIMYIFKEVSAVALISNILVVPMVPFAMLFALIAGLAGMLVPAFAGLLATPAVITMTYMLDIVRLLASLPHVLVNRAISAWQMVLMYVVLFAGGYVMFKSTEVKYDTIDLDYRLEGD